MECWPQDQADRKSFHNVSNFAPNVNLPLAWPSGMTVDRFEMKAVIYDLASNKSPGLDGLSAEHFKFAHSILSESMSTLVSSIVVHGHLPQSMNESNSAYH